MSQGILLNTGLSYKEINIKPSILLEPEAMLINTRALGHCKISRGTTISNSKIDKYFAVGLYSFMQRCSCSRYTTIGSRVSVGAFSHPTNWLSTLEFQFRDSSKFYGETLDPKHHKNIDLYLKTTYIGSDVWIGDNAFIKSGVSIGSGAIIAASAVVVNDVDPYCIVAGNPAKIIRKRFKEEIIEDLLQLKWWELDINELQGIEFDSITVAISQLKQRKGV